jgi:hypothetical protein
MELYQENLAWPDFITGIFNFKEVIVHRPNIKLKPLLWSIQSWSPQT